MVNEIKKISKGNGIVSKDEFFVEKNDANLDKGEVEGVVFVEEKREEEIVGPGPRDFSLEKNESNLDDENARNLVDMHVVAAETGDANENTNNNLDPFGEVEEEEPKVAELKNEVVNGYVTCRGQQGSVSNVSEDQETSLVNDDENIRDETDATCSVSIDGAQVDNGEKVPNLAETAVEEQSQPSGSMTEVRHGCMIDIDRDKDKETSKFQMPFAESNEDSVLADRTLNHEAGCVTKGPRPINPAEEQPKVDFGSIMNFDEDGDHGGSVSMTSLVCTTQEIKEGKAPSNSIYNPVDYITKNTKPADIETDAHDASVVDFGDGKDQHPSVFRISLLDSEHSIQEDDGIGLDSICFDATLSYQIDGYNDDPSLANLVLEVHDADSVQVDQNLMSRQDIGAESDRFTTVPIAETENWDARHEEKESNDVLNASPGSLGSVDEGNAIVDESTNGKQKLQVGNEELLKETEEQVIQTVENVQHVSYHLPPIDETNFSIYDLVWGKVKNHPWWPGQIFDPSDASNLAMKYQKKDSFLIGYYGDKTFGWCDQSQLKPFYSYFSQFVKQCSSETFMKAIRDILVEVSRRVELGMACSCLPEDEYTGIQCQKVENAGIRGGNINSIIDRPTISYYFQPDKLLEYIKTLAQFPNGTVDRLEFMIAQCQLKAFYHSKGYPTLLVFAVGGGLIESTADNSASIGKGSSEDILENSPSDLRGRPFNEQEDGFKDERKLKNIAILAESRTAVRLANAGKITSVTKVSENSILSSSGKKHVAVELSPVDPGRCNNRMLDSFGDMELKPLSPTVTSSFKIGESVLRAASQLTLRKCGPQAEHKRDDVTEFDVLSESPLKNQRPNEDDNSSDEMLSQLCLAASDPVKEYNSLSTLIKFFTGFRNFYVSGSSEGKVHVKKRKRGRPRKVFSQQATHDISCSDDEKHVVKCKRGKPRKLISQQSSSDVGCSDDEKPSRKHKRGMCASTDTSLKDDKPVEKRKSGRPRKSTEVASPNSYDKNLVQKRPMGRPKKINSYLTSHEYNPSEDTKPSPNSSDKNLFQKRPMGRPKKINSHLSSHEYNPSEDAKPVEKRKRGGPKKGSLEIVSSNISTPDHMKDSYCSDMDLKEKRSGKSHMQDQKKRRKSTNEQLRHVAMNTNMRLTFVAERSIISVEEKIVDESTPTALILRFNDANSLPSEAHLIRIFSQYGPLKEAETDVMRKTNLAKVIFRRHIDASTAFSGIGKYSIFGPGLLSYQLKPWIPKSTHDATPMTTSQDNHDVTSVATEQDMDDPLPITTVQAIHDAEAAITLQDTCNEGPRRSDLELSEHAQDAHNSPVIATPQDNQHATSIATLEVRHTSVPITRVQANYDQESIIVLQGQYDIEHIMGSNSELSDNHDSTPATAQDNLDAEPISMLQDHRDVALTLQDNHNAKSIAMPQDKRYSEQIITVQGNHNPEAVFRLQDKCDARPSVGSNLKVSEQEDTVVVSDTLQIEAECTRASPHDKHDPALVSTPQENHDAAIASSLDRHDSTSITTPENLDATPISMPRDNHDAALITSPKDEFDATLTDDGNFKASEQEEFLMDSEFIQTEDESCDLAEQAEAGTASGTLWKLQSK